LPEEEQQQWLTWGRITPRMLMRHSAQRLMSARGGDLQMFEAAESVRNALMNFQRTGGRLAMVSPVPDAEDWQHLQSLSDTRLASADDGAAANLVGELVTNREPAREVVSAVGALGQAWRAGNAERVNQLLDQMANALPEVNPGTYPAGWQRELELLYNNLAKFTIGYIGYGLATLTLILAFLIGRGWLIRLGVGLLIGGFGVHLTGVIVRGLLSGRFPIHNQFESFISLTLFAVVVGLIVMLVRRQWLFGAAAGALGTASLLLANLMPIPSDEVGQVAGILATSNILYIHVNAVLASYGLIGLGFFVSLFYLFFYYFGSGQKSSAGSGQGGDPAQASSGPGNTPLLRFAAAGVGQIDETTARPLRGRHALLGELDKAQVVILQLAFWLLGAGTLLGAYWADHAWGRWWGWDPKETWALITWLVYLIAIHARFGVQNRGLTTAWLSVVGFFVMLWTYWGVNMLLAGLHSYA
jgi:cytochrome c-type biogenesis protein CcsB